MKGRKKKPSPYYGAGEKARKGWGVWAELKTDFFLDRWDFDDYAEPEGEAQTSAEIMAELMSNRATMATNAHLACKTASEADPN